MKRGLILLAVIVPTLALLYFSLTRNPRELPSTLVGKPAPDFNLVSIDGEQVSLAGHRGKAVVLGFWATWCGPCLAEHQLIRRVKDEAAKAGILFYSILYEDTPENAREFIRRYGQAAPILIDPKLATAINYGVAGVPETFFIDATGRVIDKHAGVLTYDLLWGQMGRLASGGTAP